MKIIKIIIMLCFYLRVEALYAQKPIELHIKLGGYLESYHNLPFIRDVFRWETDGVGDNDEIKPMVSVGLEIRKWKTLIQFNYDPNSRITDPESSFGYVKRRTYKTGKYVPTFNEDIGSIYYKKYNLFNISYKIYSFKNKLNIYSGLGLSFRKESLVHWYREDPRVMWPSQGVVFYDTQFAPNMKVEIQYHIYKRFFLSTHGIYARYNKKANDYFQGAFSAGLRF